MIEIVSCIVSSYLYAYLAVFGDGSFPYPSVIQFFDMLFLLSIGKCFLTEYVPEGETRPIRDLRKIF